MTKEELFKKNFPEYVTEKGACLSPFWDLFSAGIECATYELNKGCIQTLTKENAELKKQQFSLRNERNTFLAQNEQYEKDLIDFNENLTKAKEILRGLYFIVQGRIDYENNTGIADEMWRAEQFLKG